MRLRTSLIDQLATDEGDDEGFRRPFAALVLAEVARVDRITPLFSAAERNEILATAVAYLRAIDDYRGFDEVSGWRHGVAHGADLLMQLALNPALDRAQLLQIRDAVGAQIVPAGAHLYVYGEPARLARPVLFVAARGVLTEAEWADWFAAIGSPSPFAGWGEVHSSQVGLAKLHNTRAFAQAVYVSATASEDQALAPLRAGALALLQSLS